MKFWKEFVSEENSKKPSASKLEREADKILKQTRIEAKKEKEKEKKEKGSAHTRYLIKQQKFKIKKYEEQKKRQKEKAREKALKEPLQRAEKSLSSIETQKVSANDTTATATKKSIGNVSSLASGLAGAAFHGARALAAKRKAEKEKSKQPERRERKSPGRPKRNAPTTTSSQEGGDNIKSISGTPERKRLVPATKRLSPATKKLSPAGGTPYQAPPSPEKNTGMSLGQRARRNPEFKKRLITMRNEANIFSDWKSDFLVESGLIMEVEANEKEKKKKVIDVMKGKNKIEINPNISEDHKEISSGKKKDDEGYMANVELDQMERAIKALRKKVKKADTQLPAWVQSKITRAADYIDTASEYMQSDEKLSEETDKKKLLMLMVIKGLENKKRKKNFQLNSGIIGESKKSEMKCNKPKAQAHGSGETGKSHVVKACEGGKEKLIRFGQLGVKGSPKKEGESEAYASRRHRFQSRHAKNIAKGKMSAAYWANKVKW